jgi:hypothetical protein
MTVQKIEPAHRLEYGRGEVGIVRPTFARRYLVQAYRRFAGRPPLPNAVRPMPGPDAAATAANPPPSPLDQWDALRKSVLGTPLTTKQTRSLDSGQFKHVPGDQYAEFLNCTDNAFAHAVRTANARIAGFGKDSPQMRDWVQAQVAVFANCHDDTFVAPVPAPPSADPVLRADRAYQVAAAHFYGMQFDQAEQRFRAIAQDASSPWRPYGRYLAGRTNIRLATIPNDNKDRAARLLAKAEADFRAVLADPSASELHRSAQGLLDFIAVRLHPIERLHALSKTLATAQAASDQTFADYTRLLDLLIGDTVDYSYAGVNRRAEMIQDDELSDWILSMQGDGDAALARSLARWNETHSIPWLIAVLWKLPPGHQDAPAALDAAHAVDRGSPAFQTLAFLQVRLLAAQQRRDEARALLATLPDKPDPGFQLESINLLKAERFMLARTFDELLASAARSKVVEWRDFVSGAPRDQPVFDNDAGAVFDERLPLDRLIDAAVSNALPDRLRTRIATAAFSRAVMLNRHDAAARVRPVLRTLAPALKADLDRYDAATTDADRHIAGILLLLRTPGMHAEVRGLDDDYSYGTAEPSVKFDYQLRRNWWCAFDSKKRSEDRESEVIAVLYAGQPVPFPAFVSTAEREAVARERAALAALGTAPNYLAAEAAAWARARPKDADAAEALARAVEGTRLGCKDDKTGDASRRAFDTLHRLFPQTEWAKRTKYWYK